MSSYGFVFPKQGKTTSGEVKDLCWRDDQQVFLAPSMKKISYQLNGNLATLDLDESDLFYRVYKAYLEVGGRCYDVTQTNNTSLGRVHTSIIGNQLRYHFDGYKNQTVILAYTPCLQSIEN
jgi:hypothetical protein